MDQKALCRRFCEKIKQAQLVRFKKSGYSEEEANAMWFRYKGDYLMSWRDYITHGLVSLPKGLNKVIPDVINEAIRRG